ncbi:MAG: hypothetical protein ACKVZJ_06005 [Phycisphaerales bacterium]
MALAKAKGDIAIAHLKYQNANDAERSVIQGDVLRLQQQVSELEQLASDVNELRRARVETDIKVDRHIRAQREAFSEALARFERAEAELKKYQSQSN